MAAIVQQQPAARSEESAARQFWREKMDEHPNSAGLLAIAGEVAGFFLNGHFIVALARWIIRVSGYVAESALLFAVLWISGTSVAPHLVVLVMSAKTMQSLVSVALVVGLGCALSNPNHLVSVPHGLHAGYPGSQRRQLCAGEHRHGRAA